MISCGTDFSDHANQAAAAAGALAKKLHLPLTLVHVVEEHRTELEVSPRDPVHAPVRAKLHDAAKHLRDTYQIEVNAVAVFGVAIAERLVEVAVQVGANLLVVGGLGQDRRQSHLGGAADRVAQTSPVPVLVVRDATRLVAWTRGELTLQVMVGVEPSDTSRAALRWAVGLRRIGPCDLQVTQVAWPATQHGRLGVPPPVPLDHLHPEVEQIMRRDLEAWAGEISGTGETSFIVRSGWGRVASHLGLLAIEAHTDLIVIGTHQRAGVARRWHGSVSRGVLVDHAVDSASVTVACIAPGPEEEAVALPTLHRILVPTDFSPLANRAIRRGFGLVGRGGEVHLLHVATEAASDGRLEDRLRALVPPGAAERNIDTTFEVVIADDAGVAIAQAAARFGADAICMSTHGRSGVVRLVMGSQAGEVIRRSRVPVMLVPADE